MEAHAFTGVLGHDGFVLTYALGIQSIPVEYYIINEAGEPELLAEYNGQVWELDVDGDGDREVLNLHYGLDNPAVLCRWRNGRMEAADVKAAASALLGRRWTRWSCSCRTEPAFPPSPGADLHLVGRRGGRPRGGAPGRAGLPASLKKAGRRNFLRPAGDCR